MLLSDPAPRLRDLIIFTLGSGKKCSAENLRNLISSKERNFSRPAVYKELAILKNAGIVINVRWQYRLSLSWVFDSVYQEDCYVF